MVVHQLTGMTEQYYVTGVCFPFTFVVVSLLCFGVAGKMYLKEKKPFEFTF